jgi:DNA-binding NarL/FixJ family response regulator
MAVSQASGGDGEVRTQVRCLVVDDHAAVREGVKLILTRDREISVIGESSSGDGAVEMAEKRRPDVIVMDVRMEGMDGFEATRQITAAPDPPKVLILTTFELDEYVFNALQAGASGFLLKRSPPEQLLEGIRTVAAGDGLLSPSVTRRLIQRFSSRPAQTANPRFADMTDREREVLVAIARGLSNEELAETLFISENTVKTHVKRVLTKLGARDRVQAVVMAYEGGLMDR